MADAERYQHYEVLRRDDGSLWELGRGAMGITYKAFDTNLRCPVALKVINSTFLNSEVARQRFLREARAAAALRHQNVASVFHLGTDHDSYFYAMEFIDGETVDGYMKRKGRLNPKEALGIVLQVARALAAAAKQQLVHRDLKPANLMLVDEEGEKVVKVIDFGLAKSAKRDGEDSGTLTVGGGFVGTPHYASPEQLEERDIDIRSDIYSLGATLYYMLTNRPPFSGSVAQIMSQHLYKPIPLEPLAYLPQCVIRLIERMMDKDREKRPQNPIDLRQEILDCLSKLPSTATQANVVSEPLGQPGTHATLDLSGTDAGPALLADRYEITRNLGEISQGSRFLGEDLRRDRPVLITLFKPDFVSDRKRYTALEQEIDLIHRSPMPSLREVYSLETNGRECFLVEERVIGPFLLEVLRSRSLLTPAEALLLGNFLAPVVDHAAANRLQQVDLSLSGIQLTSPDLTDSDIPADRLQRPLNLWRQLGVKVAAVDFSLSESDSATWTGNATMVQGNAGSGPRASYLGMLCLLIYEILGGPRSTVESTGRYTPIAGLTEKGNSILRRGLIDDVPSAAELVHLLGQEISLRGVDRNVAKPTSSGAAGPVNPSISSGHKSVSPPPLPTFNAPPPIQLEPKTDSAIGSRVPEQPGKGRFSVTGLILIFALVAIVVGGLGFGGYKLFQIFTKQRVADLTQTTSNPTPTATAQPSPSALTSETPVVRPTATAQPTPSAIAVETPVVQPTASPAATLPPAADEYATKLGAAQELAKNGNWKGALKSYLNLIDEYPDKNTAATRLDNLLSEQSTGKLDAGDVSEVKPELAQAAEKGIVPAMLMLGRFTRDSDPDEAIKWYENAAAKGNVRGMIEVGLLYGNRKHPGDLQKAVEYFNQAADTGDAEGKYLTGECYYYGKGVPVDIDKAVQLLREAGALGQARAMDMLGFHYEKEKQFDVARKYFEDAAAAGYPLSYSNLGVLYMKGEGVASSPEVASNLFKQGAEKGDPTGMFFYASCLEGGIGVTKDTKTAQEWYRRSARAGHPGAIKWCKTNNVIYK